MFFMPLRAACFSPQGQRGGCGIKKRGGVAAPHSLNSFVFCGLLRLLGFENDDTEKFGETIADPPRNGGGHAAPCSGAMWHALHRPPGGRYRRYLSLREGSEKTPRRGRSRKGHGTYEMAVAPVGKNPLSPSPWMIPDRSSPSRVRFAASRPGLLRADPKGVDGPGC